MPFKSEDKSGKVGWTIRILKLFKGEAIHKESLFLHLKYLKLIQEYSQMYMNTWRESLLRQMLPQKKKKTLKCKNNYATVFKREKTEFHFHVHTGLTKSEIRKK